MNPQGTEGRSSNRHQPSEVINQRKLISLQCTISKFLADYYTSHIGRVSPKIKDLQEQLRQAQYRSFTDDSL